jgi:hypothetical protein
MKTSSFTLQGLLTVVVILFLTGFLEVVTYRTANKEYAVRAVERKLEYYEKMAFNREPGSFLEDHYTIRFTSPPLWLKKLNAWTQR